MGRLDLSIGVLWTPVRVGIEFRVCLHPFISSMTTVANRNIMMHDSMPITMFEYRLGWLNVVKTKNKNVSF